MQQINRLDTRAPDFKACFEALTAYDAAQGAEVEQVVAGIIDAVRSRGDAALVEYTNRFDRRSVTSAAELELEDIEGARSAVAPQLLRVLEQSVARIRAFHERQVQGSWTYEDPLGITLGQQVTPMDRVGVYVPGGKAAYPSSVLMNVVPAVVAGVGEVIMVVPAPDGMVEPVVLAAAAVAGVHRVFTVGGAQAVAALAYGTERVPRVDKIVGPGNRYVAAAKARVFGQVGIDMVAGPSEILILSDGSLDPDWAAMDLFSQAEHDELAQAILISPDRAFLDRVEASIARLLPEMERADIIRTALADRGALVAVDSMDEAIELSNAIAPEHLEVAVADPLALLPRIRHAGAIFLGHHTPEAFGDYCLGPNHVLPTARTARFSSPLGVYDFQKRSSVMLCPPSATRAIGALASPFARSESLTAHARSAEYRRDANPDDGHA